MQQPRNMLRFWTYDSRAILFTLQNSCQTKTCKFGVEINEASPTMTLSHSTPTSVFETMLPKIADLHRICFMHDTFNTCKQCLARVVPEWKIMYSNLIVSKDNSAWLTTFFTSELPNVDKIHGCRRYSCNYKVAVLGRDPCDEISDYRVPEVSSQQIVRSSTDEIEAASHTVRHTEFASFLEVFELESQGSHKSNYFWEKLPKNINVNGKASVWACYHTTYREQLKTACAKCIAEAAMGWITVLNDLDYTGSYHLLNQANSANMTSNLTEACVNKKCKSVTLAADDECHVLSENLIEYPETKDHLSVKDSVCFGAKYYDSSKKKCINEVNATRCSKGISSMLCQTVVRTPSEYEAELDKLWGIANEVSNCRITIYDRSVCDWHRKYESHVMESTISKTSGIGLSLSYRTPNALWPSCSDTAPSAIEDISLRQVIPVLVDLKVTRCLDCIAANLEVFYISPKDDYVWITQTTEHSIAECLRQGCVFWSDKNDCIKMAPSKHPIYKL